MLYLRYQDAILFWYRYSKVFTMAKIRNIRVVVIHFFEDKSYYRTEEKLKEKIKS